MDRRGTKDGLSARSTNVKAGPYQHEKDSHIDANGKNLSESPNATMKKMYLVSKPTLMTRMVSLVIRPPNLKQPVGATLPFVEQNLPPNPCPRLVKQVRLRAGDEKVTSYRSEIKYQCGELSQRVRVR